MSTAEETTTTEQDPAPKARVRIAPKMGLREMTTFVTDLVRSARKGVPGGEFADRTFIELTPEMAEALDDVAATLDWLYLKRQSEKQAEERRKGWRR